MLKAVIVTGSRDWNDDGAVYAELDRLAPELVIHGACGLDAEKMATMTEKQVQRALKGADGAADRWARERGVDKLRMPAPWKKLRQRAGPLRNEQMAMVAERLVQCGWRVACVAFPLPKSTGSPDMMRRARRRRWPVHDKGRTQEQSDERSETGTRTDD